jgi:hypothetical protein
MLSEIPVEYSAAARAGRGLLNLGRADGHIGWYFFEKRPSRQQAMMWEMARKTMLRDAATLY